MGFVLWLDPVRDHAVMQVRDNPAACLQAKKREKRMNQARARADEHWYGERHRLAHMLKIAFTYVGRVIGERVSHSASPVLYKFQ